MVLRPQDVLVAIRLATRSRASYPELARDLGLSLSEAHGAVRRATLAGLLTADREAHKAALLEFLIHGAKYAFAPRRGGITRGIPTAHGAPPLNRLVAAGTDPLPVWPDSKGTVRGESFEPIYRSAPLAARRDPKLYEILCLVDAIRGGRARERSLAEKHLKELLEP